MAAVGAAARGATAYLNLESGDCHGDLDASTGALIAAGVLLGSRERIGHRAELVVCWSALCRPCVPAFACKALGGGSAQKRRSVKCYLTFLKSRNRERTLPLIYRRGARGAAFAALAGAPARGLAWLPFAVRV